MTTLQDSGTRAEKRAEAPEPALSVRALVDHDHHAIHEILVSPTVIEGTMRLPHAAARETAERLTPRSGTIHLVADIDGRPVGVLELVTWPDEPRHRHVGEVNLVAVHPECAGRGAGRALMEAAIELADDWLNLRRLSLVVFVDNAIAIEMYRRLGFVVEGTMVGYGFKRGKYVDAHAMARLNAMMPSTATGGAGA
jgi:putative acetyltransferase